MKGAQGYLWPTDDQMLLLRAALEPERAARAAFDRWCDHTDLSGPVDPGSLGLLPLVHENLARGDEALRHGGLIAGVRRRSFVESHRAIATAAEVLGTLDAAGIPAMVIKGVPLALDYYAAPGLRPMSDADILVTSDHAARALAALEASGWRAATGFAPRRRRHLLLSHAIEFSKGPGAEADLHWQPVHETLSPGAERQLWRRAVPVQVSGVPATMPDPSAMLMHVLLHGMRRNVKAPIRWIPDAVMILRKDIARIDWDWLLAMCREARTGYRLGLALRFLADHFVPDMPVDVIARAVSVRPGLIERMENRAILGPESGPLAMASYKAAILLRMLAGRRRAAVPGLLWHELMRQIGVARG
jgi:hypothetical protein